MKWETNTDAVPDNEHRARCGHLNVRVVQYDAFKEPGHSQYEPAQCEWFVESDQEGNPYRSAPALATGVAPSVDAAKTAARAACEQIVADMQASLRRR